MAVNPDVLKKQGTSDESSSELEVIYDKYTEETKVDKKKKGLFVPHVQQKNSFGMRFFALKSNLFGKFNKDTKPIIVFEKSYLCDIIL